MIMRRKLVRASTGLALTLAASLLVGCDAVSPQSEPLLVLEAFAETDGDLPTVRLRQTLRMDAAYDEVAAAAENAAVRMVLPTGIVSYRAVAGEPGLYAPQETHTLTEGSSFMLEATWNAAHAVGAGRIPPRIRIADVQTIVASEPIEAVLLDSLQLDSLQTGARSRYVYPIEVKLRWERPSGSSGADSLNWIRAQLKPYTDVVPGVIELIFRSEQIMREDRVALDGDLRTWTGVYLVPVANSDDPLPEHALKVALLRSDDDYARFASSRTAPDRREPVTNVEGGIGIVAGVSVDSLTFRIR